MTCFLFRVFSGHQFLFHGHQFSPQRNTTMKNQIKIVFAICAALLAARADAKLTVVATLPDYAAVAQEIGGDKVDVTALAKPTEDPHFVDARPSFIVKLNKADVL